ncbi:MAG: site-specific integrase [Muribaculaceae bacterium]|nr:site-specific integrase [Muribaculaceae bacterium]
MNPTNRRSVRLRTRKMKSGKSSLYLDIYSAGSRQYEYLGLYILPGNDAATRRANRETMKLAEEVCARRLVECAEGRDALSKAGRVRFIDYVQRHVSRHLQSKNIYMGMSRICTRLWGDEIRLDEIDRRHAVEFNDELRRALRGESIKKLSQSTVSVYWGLFHAILNAAANEELIERNPAKNLNGFAREECQREFLTFDEIKRMATTRCDDDVLKRAFMFSCLSGLRVSDIRRLRWDDFSEFAGMTRITFRQKKTGGLEYLDLSEQALRWLPSREESPSSPFAGLIMSQAQRSELLVWAQRAGIDKHITFHSARHSFAVLMLTIGTDLYTLSKLLGHREIATTKIYAHLLDDMKRAAVAGIPEI